MGGLGRPVELGYSTLQKHLHQLPQIREFLALAKLTCGAYPDWAEHCPNQTDSFVFGGIGLKHGFSLSNFNEANMISVTICQDISLHVGK